MDRFAVKSFLARYTEEAKGGITERRKMSSKCYFQNLLNEYMCSWGERGRRSPPRVPLRNEDVCSGAPPPPAPEQCVTPSRLRGFGVVTRRVHIVTNTQPAARERVLGLLMKFRNLP